MAQSLLPLMQSPVASRIVIEGRTFDNFGGSSYLGLSGATAIAAAGVAELQRTGAGMQIPATHGVATAAYQDAAPAIAAMFGEESALLLSCGYLFGILGALAMRQPDSIFYYDEHSHFALRDGIAATGCTALPYRHRDAGDLKRLLGLNQSRPVAVATDGVFSTFGDIAPLPELLEVLMPSGGFLLVDDSHGAGVLGERGRGTLEHFGLSAGSAILTGGSLGKAFGVVAGFASGSEEIIDACASTTVARGATPASPATAAMAKASVDYVAANPALIECLRANTAYAKAGLQGLGIDVGASVVPIVAFKVGSYDATARLRRQLFADGLFVYHSTYVGANAAGVIRCTIAADHGFDQIDRLIDGIRRNLGI